MPSALGGGRAAVVWEIDDITEETPTRVVVDVDAPLRPFGGRSFKSSLAPVAARAASDSLPPTEVVEVRTARDEIVRPRSHNPERELFLSYWKSRKKKPTG